MWRWLAMISREQPIDDSNTFELCIDMVSLLDAIPLLTDLFMDTPIGWSNVCEMLNNDQAVIHRLRQLADVIETGDASHWRSIASEKKSK